MSKWSSQIVDPDLVTYVVTSWNLHLENFKLRCLWCGSPDQFVWFCGRVFRDGGSKWATSDWTKSKMAVGRHLCKFQMTVSLLRVVRLTSRLILGAYCQQQENHIACRLVRLLILRNHCAMSTFFSRKRAKFASKWISWYAKTSLAVIIKLGSWNHHYLAIVFSFTTLDCMQHIGGRWALVYAEQYQHFAKLLPYSFLLKYLLIYILKYFFVICFSQSSCRPVAILLPALAWTLLVTGWSPGNVHLYQFSSGSFDLHMTLVCRCRSAADGSRQSHQHYASQREIAIPDSSRLRTRRRRMSTSYPGESNLWELTLWRPLLPYRYSYKASCARPG